MIPLRTLGRQLFSFQYRPWLSGELSATQRDDLVSGRITLLSTADELNSEREALKTLVPKVRRGKKYVFHPCTPQSLVSPAEFLE